MPRHRSDGVAGIEVSFHRRAHDAPRAAAIRIRTRTTLEIREDRLLRLIAAKGSWGDGNVLRSARGTARLRIEKRRLAGQLRAARRTLPVDVRAQGLVFMNRCRSFE